jgi:AbrB family looped-hinge helix DNA binding protein
MAEKYMLPLKKKIMDNGTITIPLEIRNSLGLQLGDEILVMIPVDQKPRAED